MTRSALNASRIARSTYTSRMTPPDNCVLIAGGGPVGLTAALCLADAGIRVRLFEAEPDIVEELRASTFHPPTLDMLERFGITA